MQMCIRDSYSAYGEYKLVWAPEEVPSEQIQRNNRVRNANPFDYRGYYYDTETGLYYCQSRYYDPEVDRFLNADTTDILVAKKDVYDKNLFAYCDNNPVVRYDTGGEFWDTLFDVVSLVISVVDVIKNPSDPMAVSYTHLDVYKRQILHRSQMAQGATLRCLTQTATCLPLLIQQGGL